jgi:hypothetical protein
MLNVIKHLNKLIQTQAQNFGWRSMTLQKFDLVLKT